MGFPQAIGHRGYKAAFPENSMAAFRGVVEVGAHAIETDLHLSKDGVVVLSHDATLKRCFGLPGKVAECDWEYLSTLRTVREPREPMARLVDLLEYISQPGQGHIWLLLDIKKDDHPNELCTAIARTIASVEVWEGQRPWNERIILAGWNVEWVAACLRHIPGFPVALTNGSPSYASAMLPVPGLNFSLLNYTFATGRGSRFVKKAKQQGRKVFSWSDNAEEWMAASIRNGVDGVITDDPKQFLALCKEWEADGVKEKASRSTTKQMCLWAFVNVLVFIYEIVTSLKGGSPQHRVKEALGV